MDFSKFFEQLSYELKQSVDEDASSRFEYLDFDNAMFYTNEAILELVRKAPHRFTYEEPVTFNEDTKIWKLPEMYNFVSHYKYKGLWYAISDSSDRFAATTTTGERVLEFNPPIKKGGTIILRIVKRPMPIYQSGDRVDFPDDFLRFLRIHIMKKAAGRKGKELSNYILQEYDMDMIEWRAGDKPVKNTSFMHFRGYGFGRGRRG